MAKIPFDIKYRDKIESGEYKVVTEDDEPARIICWDSTINKERPIIAIVFDDQIEQYKADGHYDNDYDTSNYDLFIVTPEDEMSEFVKEYCRLYKEGYADGQAGSEQLSDAVLKASAAELLAISRKEALKDLPRWEKKTIEKGQGMVDVSSLEKFDYIRINGYLMKIEDLEKLPKFDEDEK